MNKCIYLGRDEDVMNFLVARWKCGDTFGGSEAQGSFALDTPLSRFLLGVQGSGLRVEGLVCSVQGLEFRVEGSGFRA
jgi:hypothetical protein